MTGGCKFFDIWLGIISCDLPMIYFDILWYLLWYIMTGDYYDILWYLLFLLLFVSCKCCWPGVPVGYLKHIETQIYGWTNNVEFEGCIAKQFMVGRRDYFEGFREFPSKKIISRLFESCILEIWNPEDDLDNNCTLQVPIITFLVYTHTISYSHQISIPAQIIVLSRTMITLW